MLTWSSSPRIIQFIKKSENANSMTVTVPTSIWHSGWGLKQWMHWRILHRHSLFSCCFRCLLWTILPQFLLVHATGWKGQDPKWACSKKKHKREFHLKLIGLQKSTLPWLGVLTTVSPCLLFTMSELFWEGELALLQNVSAD